MSLSHKKLPVYVCRAGTGPSALPATEHHWCPKLPICIVVCINCAQAERDKASALRGYELLTVSLSCRRAYWRCETTVSCR